MKRTFLLVLVAVVVLLLLLSNSSTDTKVTPNHTTLTDMVEYQHEIRRALAFLRSTEHHRKEVTRTPTPLPSPTPKGGKLSLKEDKINTSLTTSTGPIVENVWITFYDCTLEGFCPVEEGGNYTASGTPLKKGALYAACDPNYWPFGTKIKILEDPNEYVWTCVDTGSLVIGPTHWDVWFYKHDDGRNYLAQLGSDTTTVQLIT